MNLVTMAIMVESLFLPLLRHCYSYYPPVFATHIMAWVSAFGLSQFPRVDILLSSAFKTTQNNILSNSAAYTMATRNQKIDGSHLRFRVQPFYLQTFYREMTFLARGNDPVQPRVFPEKREVVKLLSTDHLYRDWDAKFLNFDQVTGYKDMIMSSKEVEEFNYERIQYKFTSREHLFYRILSDHKSILDTHYGRFGAFLVRLAERNRSEDIGEKNYEYYLNVLRMLTSVASRCQDLLTIGFQYSPVDPDIYPRYREAVCRACKVSQGLLDDVYAIMHALFDQGLARMFDMLDYHKPNDPLVFEILKSESLAKSGVRYAGVSPRDDPAIRDRTSNRTKTVAKTRFGERPYDSTGLRPGDSIVHRWRRESFCDP